MKSILCEIGDATSHIWTENSVFIQTKCKENGRSRFGKVEINFSSLKVDRDGLLEQVILDLRWPLHPLIASTFSYSLKSITKISSVRSKLSTNVNKLNYADIWKIFQHIESYIKTKNYSDPYALYIKAVQPFKYCKTTLSNGQMVSDIQYRTSYKYVAKKYKKLISESYDEGIEDVEMSYPLSHVRNSSITELEEKSVKHLQIRLDRMSDACVKIIEQHLSNVSRIKECKKQDLPATYTPQKIESIVSNYISLKDKKFRIPEHDRLHFFLFLIEKYELYKAQVLPMKFSFSNLPCQLDNLSEWGEIKPETYLLSDYYLPRNVVFACLIMLLFETGWNSSTLLTLSKDRVDQSVPDEFKLEGIKLKTNQIQSYVIKNQKKDSAGSSWPYRCLQLLIENDSNIKSYATRLSDSIFLSKVNRTGLNANIFESLSHIQRDIEYLCMQNKLPKFNLKDIRDQKANLEYLQSGKNPYVVMTTLGHKDLSTVSAYLNTNILRILNEANINEYMRRLGNTILFAGDIKNDSIVTDELEPNDNSLLFPISPYSDKSIADEWLNDVGDLEILIGRAEIKHCAIQMKYYKEAIPSLKNSNAERFKRFHIPRILFCIAMYRFIYESEYRGVLREIENELNNG
jgi:integrase